MVIVALALLGVVLTPSAESATTDTDLTVSSDLPSARLRAANLEDGGDDAAHPGGPIAGRSSIDGPATVIADDESIRDPLPSPPIPAPVTSPVAGPDTLRGPPIATA